MSGVQKRKEKKIRNEVGKSGTHTLFNLGFKTSNEDKSLEGRSHPFPDPLLLIWRFLMKLRL